MVGTQQPANYLYCTEVKLTQKLDVMTQVMIGTESNLLLSVELYGES